MCFLPDWFRNEGTGGMLRGDVKYVPVDLDRAAFEDFLGKLAALLEQPTPPAPSPTCVWCAWQVLRAG